MSTTADMMNLEATTNSSEPDLSVTRFAEQNAGYFQGVFDQIQHNTLSRFHMNWLAGIIGFFWAARRGNWLLFWGGLALDVIAFACLAQYLKYQPLLEAAIAADKANLIERYSGWIPSYLFWGFLILLLGRLAFAWCADRFYYRQYGAWRIKSNVPFGVSQKRVVLAALIVALLVPLTLYRATQQRLDDRECLKVHRELAKEQPVSMKRRFDCWFIDDFPVMHRFDAPMKKTYRLDRASGDVTLTESTHALLGDEIECEALGAHRLKGVAEPVRIYSALHRSRAPLVAGASSRMGVGGCLSCTLKNSGWVSSSSKRDWPASISQSNTPSV